MAIAMAMAMAITPYRWKYPALRTYVNLRTYRTNPLSPNDPAERYRFPSVSHSSLRLPGSEREGEREIAIEITIIPSTGYSLSYLSPSRPNGPISGKAALHVGLYRRPPSSCRIRAWVRRASGLSMPPSAAG